MSRVELDIIANDRASRPLDKIGDSADDAGDSFKGMGDEAKTLDGEIGRLEGSLAKLRTEIAKAPDDKSLRRQYNVDRRALGFLEKVKADAAKAADLGKDIGIQAGKGISQGLGDTFAALPAQLKGGAIVIGGTMAAAMAPVIGATIGGAVLGGVGAGGIIGGIALAAQNPTVKAAATGLGEDLMGAMGGAAESFERPLLAAFDSINAAGSAFFAERGKDFSSLAPLLKPLADGVTGFGFAMGPGLSKAFEASKPALRVIANELPKIGAAVGYALGRISDESDGGTMALARLLHTTEKVIMAGGEFVAWSEDAYEGMTRFTAGLAENAEAFYGWLSVIAPPALLLKDMWGDVADDANDSIKAMEDGKNATNDWTGALNGFADVSKTAADAVEAFSDAIDEAFGNQMNQDEALIRYREGLVKVKEELKDGTKTLSLNSVEGRENRKALLAQLEAIERLRVANVANGVLVEDANQAYGEQVTALQAMAQSAGFSKTALDKLFGPYAGKIFGTALEISTPGLADALRRLRELRRLLKDDKIYESTLSHDDSHQAGEGRAAGGPMESGATYRVAEGGGLELGLFGTQGQMFSAAQTVKMLAGASGGSGGTTEILVSAKPGAESALADLLLGMLRFEVRRQGGSVQDVIGASA